MGLDCFLDLLLRWVLFLVDSLVLLVSSGLLMLASLLWMLALSWSESLWKPF